MSAKDWFEIFEWRVDDDGVTITKFRQKNATSVDVPSEIDGKPVVAIGDKAFSGCKSLTKVSLPEGLQTIGDETFSWCSSLTEVSFPASLQTIGDKAFYDCESLLNFWVAKGNANFRSVDGVLFSADGKTLILYPAGRQEEEYVVPGDVEIADGAFAGWAYNISISKVKGSTRIIWKRMGWGKFDLEAHVDKLLELKKMWPERKRNLLAELATSGSLERTPEEQREWEERHPGFMSESEGATLRYWRESEN